MHKKTTWAPEGSFPGELNVVKVHFTNSKLRGKDFFTKTLIGKYYISKSKRGFGPPVPPSDAHGNQ